MNKLYNVLSIIYFVIVVPLSGFGVCFLTENTLLKVVAVIGIAVIHGVVAGHFFDPTGRLGAVVFLMCITSGLLYSFLGDFMLFTSHTLRFL